MKDQFLVGELAALFHISADTLRYYDKIELIKPDIVGENGYRYYSLRSFFKLSRILFLRDLDIPLDEIKGYMNNKNSDKLIKLLELKQHDLDHKIQSCLNLKSKIQEKLDLLSSAKNSDNEVQIRHLPARNVLYLSSSDDRDLGGMKKALKTYGHLLKHSSWMTEGQIYTAVKLDDLNQGIFDHFDYLFEIPDSESHASLKRLEAQAYACLVFIGSYSHIDQHYKRLIDWIGAHGYEPSGHSIEKNIVDYDFADSEEDYISELQIPIRKRLP